MKIDYRVGDCINDLPSWIEPKKDFILYIKKNGVTEKYSYDEISNDLANLPVTDAGISNVSELQKMIYHCFVDLDK